MINKSVTFDVEKGTKLEDFINELIIAEKESFTQDMVLPNNISILFIDKNQYEKNKGKMVMKYKFITRNHLYHVHNKDVYYPEDVAEIITAILKHEKVDFSRVNIKDYEDKQIDEFHLN